MRMKPVLAALLLLAATPAWASYDIPPIEPVYAVTAGRSGVTVRLASGGCTRKADLTVALSTKPPRPLLLIARRRPDACRTSPGGAVDVVWSYAELGIKPGQAFSVANPLVAGPTPDQTAEAARPVGPCRRLEVVAVVAPGQGAVRLLGLHGELDIEAQPLVASGEVTGAEPGVDGGGNVVRLALNAAAASRLSAWTGAHKGGRIAFLFDGQVIQESVVGGPIGAGGLQLSGLDRNQAVSIATGIGGCLG